MNVLSSFLSVQHDHARLGAEPKLAFEHINGDADLIIGQGGVRLGADRGVIEGALAIHARAMGLHFRERAGNIFGDGTPDFIQPYVFVLIAA